MQITCPHCNFSRQVDFETIPDSAMMASCPSCGQKFDFKENARPDPPQADPAKTSAGRPAEDDNSRFDPQDESMEEIIPWEDDYKGFVSAFFENVIMILFSPARFFEAMPVEEGYKSPLAFGVLAGSLGAIINIFWGMLGLLLFGKYWFQFLEAMGTQVPLATLSSALNFVIAGAVFYMILTPFIFVIGIVIISIWAHFFLMLVLGNKSGFQATFRVVSYSSAVSLFQVIPGIGPFLSFIWGMVLYLIGFSEAHEIGMFRVVFALIFLPFFLFILFVFGVLYYTGLLQVITGR